MMKKESRREKGGRGLEAKQKKQYGHRKAEAKVLSEPKTSTHTTPSFEHRPKKEA